MYSVMHDRSPSRCELDDVLQHLDIRDDVSCWMDGAADTSKAQPLYSSESLFYALEEEADACDPFVYDPLMFTPSSSAPSSKPPTPLGGSFLCLADRDKPLPTLPHYSSTPSPPSTPRSSRSSMSTPPSSPRLSLAPSGSQTLPRSRPPSANMTATRSMYTHAAFPSISSTLSLLEERETEVEKRSGVIVTEMGQPASAPNPSRNSSESTIIAHAARRSVSADPLMVSSNGRSPETGPTKKPRPTLNLSTSQSSLQLRELAELAHTPASPILTATYTTSPAPISSPIDTPSPRTVKHVGSFASLSPAVSSPLASSSFLLPPVEVEPPSRWSMDSVSRPIQPVEPSASPKPRKRGRFMSLISRARAGSVTKPTPTPTPRSLSFSHENDFGLASPHKSSFSHTSTNSTSSLASQARFSHSTFPPPPPMAVSPSTASTTSSSSHLPTPADSQCDIHADADPFCPASPTFAPASYLPEPAPFEDAADGRMSPPLEPTLPAPSPSVPTTSFFGPPAHSQSAFPFLAAALSKTKLRRRRKKLVISCIASSDFGEGGGGGRAPGEAQRRERETKKRYDSVLRWCESFGAVRRVERKPDGSMHVHWKDWEVADMVCRVSGQVMIKGVGRVSLAWRYVN